MKANSAFTIQQQEIMKILGNSGLDLEEEMNKLFEKNLVSQEPNSKQETMVLLNLQFIKFL